MRRITVLLLFMSVSRPAGAETPGRLDVAESWVDDVPQAEAWNPQPDVTRADTKDEASRVCDPGARACQSGTVVRCDDDGGQWRPVETCADRGLVCLEDRCVPDGDGSGGGGCAAGTHASSSAWALVAALGALVFVSRRRPRRPGERRGRA